MHRHFSLPQPTAVGRDACRRSGSGRHPLHRCSTFPSPRRPYAVAAAAPDPPNASSTTPDAPWPVLEERGARFTPGAAFYRGESAQARDLAVLAAAAHRRRAGALRVLDVMAGSGVRAARYISQAGADCVWSNDYNPTNRPALVFNAVSAMAALGAAPPCVDAATQPESSSSSAAGLEAGAAAAQAAAEAAELDPKAAAAAWAAGAARLSDLEGLRGDVLEWRGGRPGQEGGGITCRVSSVEANR